MRQPYTIWVRAEDVKAGDVLVCRNSCGGLSSREVVEEPLSPHPYSHGIACKGGAVLSCRRGELVEVIAESANEPTANAPALLKLQDRVAWIAGWRGWVRFADRKDDAGQSWLAGWDAAAQANNEGGERPTVGEAEGEYERYAKVSS